MRPIQMDLFSDQLTLNIAKAIKVAMNDDVRSSAYTRERIVDRMNDLAERHGVCLAHGNSKQLTLETLEKWLNAADLTRLIPVRALPVFCAAVGQYSALHAIAQPLGLRVIGEKEQKLLAWAEAKLEVQKRSRQIRRIEAEL